MDDRDALGREVAILREVELTIRGRLYSVDSAGVRATAVSALAAAAAERAYLRSDTLSQLTNMTSDRWRRCLADVWAYLEGDAGRHYALSNAIAEFLTSPLNHNEGQDGPNDFDRPQTIASYSAAASVIFWGVDFATTAVAQIFDLIDLKYDVAMPPAREHEVEDERTWALGVCDVIVRAADSGRGGFTVELLAELRQ